MGKVAEVVGVLFLVLAAVMFSVAMGTDQWYETKYLKQGLWKFCVRYLNTEKCEEFEWNASVLEIFVPRVLMITAAAFVGVGILLEVLSWCAEASTRNNMMTIQAVMHILGGIAALCAAAAFTAFKILPASSFSGTHTFGYCLYLVYAAGLLFIIGGFCMCCAKNNQMTQVHAIQTSLGGQSMHMQQFQHQQMP